MEYLPPLHSGYASVQSDDIQGGFKWQNSIPALKSDGFRLDKVDISLQLDEHVGAL